MSEMSGPDWLDVSVIIPAYNSETTIERAINSVVSKEHAVDEITVVDDGSSVRYYFQDNAGVSTVRNVGIMNSRCEWIAFLYADDEWLPNWVRTHQ